MEKRPYSNQYNRYCDKCKAWTLHTNGSKYHTCLTCSTRTKKSESITPKGEKMSVKFICPQCQSPLQEVLDSDGGVYICRSDFHGKVSPQFTRETLETAYVVGTPDKALPVEESRPTMPAPDAVDSVASSGIISADSLSTSESES